MMTTASSLDRVHGCRSSSQLQLSSQVFLRCEYHFHRVIFSTLVKAAQQTLITHSVLVCVCVRARRLAVMLATLSAMEVGTQRRKPLILFGEVLKYCVSES